MLKLFTKAMSLSFMFSFGSGIVTPLQAKVFTNNDDTVLLRSTRVADITTQELNSMIRELSLLYYRHAEMQVEDLRNEVKERGNNNLEKVNERILFSTTKEEKAYFEKMHRSLERQIRSIDSLKKQDILNKESEFVHSLIQLRDSGDVSASVGVRSDKQIGKRIGLTLAGIFMVLCFVSVVLMPITFKYLDKVQKAGDELGPIPSR